MRTITLLLALTLVAAGQTASPVERARDTLERALKDKNPDTRKEAVLALSLAGPREPFLSMLDSMLADRDVQVRLAVVASLVDLKTKRTAAYLKEALKDEVPEVSFAAARALWALNDPAGREALLSVLGGETKTAS